MDVHSYIYMWEKENLDSDLKLIEPSEKVSLGISDLLIKISEKF